MAISKRPGRPKPWLARYRTPFGDERAKAFRRKVDAERWLAAQEADRLQGQWIDPRLAKTTFGEWLPNYLAARVHLALSTRVGADSMLRNHVLPYFEHRPLGSVTRTEAQAFISELQAKGLAPATIRQCYLLARGVFASAVDSDVIARNPLRGVRLPKPDHVEMRFLDQAEIDALVEATDPRHAAVIATAAYTGARFGELAALRMPRVDFLRGSMTIVEQLTEVNGQVIIGPPKTPASRRQIALPRVLTDALAAHLEAYPAVDGYVFTSPEGTPLRRHNFRRRVFVPAVRASVGEPMRFHDLRHSHVAMLIALGQHPKVIQTRLGHSSIKVTLDQYGHLYEGLDEEAAARIDEMVAATRADQTRTKDAAKVLGFPTRDSETP